MREPTTEERCEKVRTRYPADQIALWHVSREVLSFDRGLHEGWHTVGFFRGPYAAVVKHIEEHDGGLINGHFEVVRIRPVAVHEV